MNEDEKDVLVINFLSFFITGLLRLQQIYQGLKPGNETFHVQTVKRIANASDAIDFLRTLEEINRWSNKHVVLDCPTDMAKEIVVNHVRDISLGRRNYHYLLSGLVSSSFFSSTLFLYFSPFFYSSYLFMILKEIIIKNKNLKRLVFFFCFFFPDSRYILYSMC